MYAKLNLRRVPWFLREAMSEDWYVRLDFVYVKDTSMSYKTEPNG